MTREEYEQVLMNRLIASMKRHGLEQVAQSVILTGSFGRDEATYEVTNEGVVLKSDVELALVCKRTNQKVAVLIASVQDDFSEEINLFPVSVRRVERQDNFNGAAFKQNYKTIFTYDLFHGSKTLWGKDFIKGRQFPLSQVDDYEAKRIVANRIGELVCRKDNLWQGKLLLAIGSAYLLLTGEYRSSYHEQRDRLIDRKEAVDQLFGNSFLNDYQKAFAYLRENGEAVSFSQAGLQSYTASINSMFVSLKKPKVNSLSRFLKYGIKYLRCGLPLGCFGFEDRIITNLIKEFCVDGTRIEQTARLWEKVLY